MIAIILLALLNFAGTVRFVRTLHILVNGKLLAGKHSVSDGRLSTSGEDVHRASKFDPFRMVGRISPDDDGSLRHF
ncbi:hypothetical protein [Paraburkholderia sp. PGU19]|uniref:hypothetical protein n=1 Tax=Paraburkholderia sp. PGU19 TaxID=2735434 RepID=UPI0015DB824B|nr:hypothetical protein [Paraburkholderia sp. PGU19]